MFGHTFIFSILISVSFGYSVNEDAEEQFDADFNSSSIILKQDKTIKLQSLDQDLTSDDQSNQPAAILKKYKNYGYFNPSIATNKINKNNQLVVPIQIKQNRLIQSLTTSSNLSNPIFHFQRRLDEHAEDDKGDEDLINGYNKKVKISGHVSNPRYNNERIYNYLKEIPIRFVDSDAGNFENSQQKPEYIGRGKTSYGESSTRISNRRRNYLRNFKSDGQQVEGGTSDPIKNNEEPFFAKVQPKLRNYQKNLKVQIVESDNYGGGSNRRSDDSLDRNGNEDKKIVSPSRSSRRQSLIKLKENDEKINENVEDLVSITGKDIPKRRLSSRHIKSRNFDVDTDDYNFETFVRRSFDKTGDESWKSVNKKKEDSHVNDENRNKEVDSVRVGEKIDANERDVTERDIYDGIKDREDDKDKFVTDLNGGKIVDDINQTTKSFNKKKETNQESNGSDKEVNVNNRDIYDYVKLEESFKESVKVGDVTQRVQNINNKHINLEPTVKEFSETNRDIFDWTKDDVKEEYITYEPSDQSSINGQRRMDEYINLDIENLDREYRKLVNNQKIKVRSLKERSLTENQTSKDTEDESEPIEERSTTFFIPTPIPGFQYSTEDNEVSTKLYEPSSSTYFVPTRPYDKETLDQNKETVETLEEAKEKLSDYYNANTTKTGPGTDNLSPIVFVTAINEITEKSTFEKISKEEEESKKDIKNMDVQLKEDKTKPLVNETVSEEISERKNFSIEDFYNAFDNATEIINRHRDEAKAVTTSSASSFLGLAPHFPSSSLPPLVSSSAVEVSTVSDGETSRAIKYPCTCDKGKCGCCTGRLISNFNINLPSRGCLNITYIPEDFEFNLKMTYNDRTLAQRRVSGKNPRPMCVPLPRLTGRAQACVKLSNVYMVGRNVHMCLDLEAKVQDEELFKVSFDCVRMGTSGIKWIKPEDGGGLGPPPVIEGPAPDDYDAVVASEGDDITSAKDGASGSASEGAVKKKKDGPKKKTETVKTDKNV